jgi:hypothetical protein
VVSQRGGIGSSLGGKDLRPGAATRLLALLAWIVLTAISARDLAAHGGGTARLVDEPVGPYSLYVWTKPDPIRIGRAHFTVGVFSRPAGSAQDEPVLDADVELALVSKAGGNGWQGRASREASVNKLYYEADVTIPAEGEWQVTVRISGPSGGGSAEFNLIAVEAGINWMLVGGAAVAIVASGWWFFGLRQQEKSE